MLLQIVATSGPADARESRRGDVHRESRSKRLSQIWGKPKCTSSAHSRLRVSSKQKSWELPAAMSMARLWRYQGKGQESRELLAPVYSWLTEGFDTRDLRDAKELLSDLTT